MKQTFIIESEKGLTPFQVSDWLASATNYKEDFVVKEV